MTAALHTARLTLRRPMGSDWPAFRDFMLSERAAVFGSHGHEGRAFRTFAAELGHWDIFGYGMWAVTETGSGWGGAGRALALVGPWSPPDWPEREIGWMVLAPEAEGRGVAFEAARAALAHAFEALGWETVVSYIEAGNARSIRLAERLGARLDPDAAAPSPREGRTLLVYRHSRPGAEATPATPWVAPA